ncbi:MAG TPA: hypothetical protein VF950_10815 [Planctomycetota bacterium]
MKRLLVLLLLALAAVGLPGGSGCDGNLGDVSSGPISFRVSVARNFAPADGPSTRPTANFDGSLVAFESRALNLARTEPSFREILIRDRNTQTVTSASRLVFETNKAGLADCESPSMSNDGDWVIFTSRRDLGDDPATPGPEAFSTIWRYNRFSNTVGLIIPTLPSTNPSTPIDGNCFTPSVSGNGQVIAFASEASNIETNPAYAPSPVAQIFATDLTAGSTTRLISHAFGAPGTPCNNAATNPVVSADGEWIVFESRATNLIAGGTNSFRKIYRASRDGSVVELVSRMDGLAGAEASNHCTSTSVNGDGSLIGFAFQGGNLALAPNSGDLGFPLIVRDYSDPLNPVNRVVANDCFLFGIFNPVLVGDRAAMSVDGLSIAYTASRLPGLTDLDIRVADTSGGGTRVISKGIIEPGVTTLEDLFVVPTISGDGRWAFWRADYSQEVIGDTNALGDVFGYGPLR